MNNKMRQGRRLVRRKPSA